MDFGTLPLALVRRVDRACDRFEDDWRADRRPEIESYLEDAAGPERPVLLHALLASELELRRGRGERPTSREYRERFASWADVVDSAFGKDAAPREGEAGESDPGHAQTIDHPGAAAVVLPGGDDLGRATPEGRRFLVLKSHARGGLGEVFVAHDLELNREVALKAIQDRHAGDSYCRWRFLLEAEITGSLEHPGVVPVYSLGRGDDGRPYYTMRFIRGESLREAIARFHAADGPGRDPGERSLALRQLLTRFIDVCDAVGYAHSRGVLHRDLKPANVMLGPYGETLVVDWGLAKSMDRKRTAAEPDRPPSASTTPCDPSLTQTGATLGTPQYMSPEQAAGRLDRLGPASDVYGLGATLYHLLAGRAPFQDRDTATVLDRVQRGEFPPPREVSPQVPRALEAIALKAMALRPGDRYATTRDLAGDLERWLADEPVSAHPESPAARMARWIRRHRTWAIAGTSALLLITAVSVGSALIVGRALGEQRRARRETQDLLRLVMEENEEHYREISRDLILAQPGLRDLRQTLLKRPLGFYERLSRRLEAEPDGDPEAQVNLARAYFGLATLSAVIGEKSNAMDAYRRAAEVNDRLIRSNPSDHRFRSDLARCYGYIGDLQLEGGRLDEAASSYRASHRIRDDLRRDRPGDGDAAFQLARSHRNFGRLLRALGRPDEAIASYRDALGIERGLVGRHPGGAEYLHDLARTLENIGIIHREAGRFRESLGSLLGARSLFGWLVEAHPDVMDYRGGLASSTVAIAMTHRDAGHPEEAYRSCRAASAIFVALERGQVATAEFQFAEAQNLIVLGRLDFAREQPDEARLSLDKARNALQRLVRRDPANPEYQNQLGVTLNTLGLVLESLGERRAALAMYRQAIRSQCSALARNPRLATFWRSLDEGYGDLASAAEGEELSPEEAELYYEASCDLASCIAATRKVEAKGPSRNKFQLSLVPVSSAVASVVGRWCSSRPGRLQGQR